MNNYSNSQNLFSPISCVRISITLVCGAQYVEDSTFRMLLAVYAVYMDAVEGGKRSIESNVV